MEFPKDLKRVECPEPVEGLTWVYILLIRNDMLYVGQSKKRIQSLLLRHSTRFVCSWQAKRVEN